MTEIRERVSLVESTLITIILLGYSHPEEGSDLGNLGCLSRQRTVGHGGSRSNDLLGELLVGIDGASEGVTAEGDRSSTSGSSGDGTIFNRAGGSKSARDGRSQQGGVETLHVVDLRSTRVRCRDTTRRHENLLYR